MANLDLLDKKILQILSEGSSSYQNLAKACQVSRNTIYRRMSILEKKGIIGKSTNISINYEKLGITRINIAINVHQEKLSALLTVLKAYPKIKFLYKAYGTHNIILFAFCDKGSEGNTINEIRAITEKYAVLQMDVSICFSFEKIDLTPYSNIEKDPKSQSIIMLEK
jgi:DNA-binding Lrp family transcriptional regulator